MKEDILIALSETIKSNDHKLQHELQSQPKVKHSSHDMIDSIITTHKFELRRYASQFCLKDQVSETVDYIDRIMRSQDLYDNNQFHIKRQLLKIGVLPSFLVTIIVMTIAIVLYALLQHFVFDDFGNPYNLALFMSIGGLFLFLLFISPHTKFRLYSIKG